MTNTVKGINYNNIDNELKNLILSNNLIDIGEPKKVALIAGLKNPNGLDIASEIKIIGAYLKNNPAKAQHWKVSWPSRLQSWIIRTKRHAPVYVEPPKPEPIIETKTPINPDDFWKSIPLLQEFLMKHPTLYKQYPNIYTKVPFPDEWNDPEHWGFYFRYLRKGHEYLYDSVGPCPDHIAKKYGINIQQQQQTTNHERDKNAYI